MGGGTNRRPKHEGGPVSLRPDRPPFLSPDLTDAEHSRLREEILERVHAPPEGGSEKTVSARSLRRWRRAYRGGGFAALHPKARCDKEKPSRITTDVLEKAVALR